MKQTTVVYHSADYDGIFCREIAKHFLGTEGVEYIGWNFGDATLPFPEPDRRYIVMDLPLDKPFGVKFEDGWLARDNPFMTKEQRQIQPIDRIEWAGPWVWIDHHKSAIESHPANIPGRRIDGVAACRLAWQWFNSNDELAAAPERGYDPIRDRQFPAKQDFIDRRVSEPLAIRLAGEYDIWDKRDPNAECFQFGLRSKELSENDWDLLLSPSHEVEGKQGLGLVMVNALIENGQLLQTYQQRNDAGMMGRSFLLEWEGLKFLALTTARCNSLTFAAKDIPETGHDALLGFYYNGIAWVVSLYHAKHRTELDLSAIAVRYGGGGHRGACGFSVGKLPFMA